MIPLTGENYCAPYPISVDAGGVSVDKNTFDKRRSALILCAAAAEAKEYYRLDFSRQLFSTSVGKDASNEYLDIEPNAHYVFHVTGVKSGGYSSAAGAWKNPGSNIEYTVTVSGDGWKSSTGNGQYLVRTDRDTVLVLKNVAAASDLVKFACQMPDAGQKPGGELPGSVETRVVSLVGYDKETPVDVGRLQLCRSDGTPVENNTFDFSGETIPADGYRLKYIAGADVPSGRVYVKIRYGNIDHYVPVAFLMFYVRTNVNTITYQGRKDATLDARSYYLARPLIRTAPGRRNFPSTAVRAGRIRRPICCRDSRRAGGDRMRPLGRVSRPSLNTMWRRRPSFRSIRTTMCCVPRRTSAAFTTSRPRADGRR